MKKLYFLCFCIGLSSFSQLNAQCPYNNTYYTTVTPPCPGSTTVSCMYGGEYVTVNVVAGNVYTFSTCGSTNFDSQLTLYNNTGTTVLAYNDDACGLQSSITWTATYTGTVQILLDQYYCSSISSCMDLTISCAPPGGSGSGCNTNTILCQNSAGPFSFGSPGPAVSTCLDWYATSQFAYILVNITTTGPLSLLINGNAASGFLDVAVFNIPTNQDPCTAIQNTANQLGCNYASASSGCNQFGTYYGCASSVPSPFVTAGQTIMIVVEDWLNGPSSTFNLQLGPPPNAQSGPPNPTITPVGPFCITSSSVQLTAVDMGGTWSGPGVSPSGLFNPSIAGVGTHTINYTIGQPPCQANSSITITVTATPTPTITPATASICTGQSINLTAGGGGTYQWNTGATTAGITVSPGVTTTYTVTVTLSGGCTATTSRTVTVNSPPTASISPATTSICAGQSTTLTASGGGTYAWNTGATTAGITVSPGATTTYTVTVTNAAGCTATATRTVTVNPLPTPSITGTNTICTGQSTTLTASGGGTYQWNTGATTAGITVSPGATTSYTVTVTSVAGCTGTASTTVTVNPLPTPSITGTNTICAGQSTTLTASGGGTYQWNTGATTAGITVSPGATTSYTVTVTSVAGCTGTASTTVTVNPLPTPSITGTNTICTGQSTTLTASGGGTYQWNTGATTAGITVSPGATTTYTVTVTNAAGCTATATRTVTVNPLPTPSITGTNTICTGQSTTLTASGGGTYQWNTGATTAGITVSPGATTSYTVTVTSVAGCTGTASTTVTVNPLPTPSITGTNTICAGQSTTLTASGGGTYQWNTGATTAGITVSPGATTSYTVTVTSVAGCTGTASTTVTVNPLPTPSITGTNTICTGQSTTLTASGGGTYAWNTGATTAGITVSPGATTTYTVTVTNAAGCTATATRTVTVNPLPTPSITGTNTICAGQSTTLTASGGGTYQWNTGATTAGITVSPGATTSYTVTVTSVAGCTGTASTTVTVNPLPTPSITGTNTICTGQSTTLTASGGGTYQWNTGATTAGITVSPGATTTYTVTVTNAAGCTASSSQLVTVNPLPTPTAGNNGPLCTSNTLNLTSSGGGSYSWTGPGGFSSTQQNPSIPNTTVANGGTYTVTVTSASGCTATASTTVTINPDLVVSASSNAPVCVGATLTLSTAGGTSYSWVGPGGFTSTQQNPSIPNATTGNSGTYTVTVTNASGCTGTASTTVTVNPLPTPSITGTNTICAGQSTTLTASGGGTYQWNTGATTAGITVSPGTSTTYTVTVSSAAGCTASSSQLVTVNPLPTPTAGNNGPLCTTNTLNLTSSGGGSYSWTGPGGFSSTQQNPSIPNITVANGGTYTVTVTSASGCTATASTTVTINPDLVVSASSNAPVCVGATLTLSTAGGTSYSWVGPGGFTSTQQNPSIPNATTGNSGTYTVTVTNASGCTGTASTTVTVNPLPTPSITGTNTICAGQSTILTASGGGTYQWNTGATTAGITVSPGATTTYTVTVTNAAGCTASSSQLVTVNPLPIPTISGASAICAGQSTILTANGGSNYSWNTGSVSNNITVNPLTTTTYTVTVTDVNGCTASTSYVLTINPSLNVNVTTDNNVSCFGFSDGSLTATPSGGTPGFTYVWSNGSNNATATGLPFGIYTVTVTDAAGCTGTATGNITQPTPVNTSLAPSVYAGGYNVSGCVSDGSIDQTVTGGTSTYTYQWSNGQTTEDISGLAAGTYTVTVTDANGCTVSSSITLTAPSSVTAATSSATYAGGWNISCNGMSDGSIDLTVGGGAPGYSYSWSSGQTTEDISGVAVGTYTVTVTDANGCTASSSITLTQPPVLSNGVTSATYVGGWNISCNGLSNGSIDQSVTGGTSTYTYQWSSSQTTEDISGVAVGTYTVTVTDANGCTASTSITLTEPPVLSNNVTAATYVGGWNISCNGMSNGSIDQSVTGGTSTYTYQWSSSQTTEDISGVAAGTYTVTVTDANGCTASTSITLTQPTPVNTSLAPSVYAGGYNVSGCVNDGSIDQTVTGGTAGYTYQWSNGLTTEDISGLVAGTYTVTVTDANGCTVSSSITLTAPSPVTAATSSATYAGGWNISCNGMSDGSIDLTVGGGAPGYSYSWSSGQTTEDISGVAAGTYTVTVTDANGCTASSSITLTQPPVLSNGVTSATYVGGWNISCNGLSNGSIDQSVTGGTSTYTYQWSSSQTTEDISGVAAGTYTVTVTDANNCTASTSITLTEPPVLSNNVTAATYVGGWNISCNGMSNGSIDQSVTGGTSTYTYQWNSGQTSEDISGVAAGTYTVTVTDANGCTASTSITLTQPTPVNTSLAPSVYAGGYNVSGCVNDGSIDQTVTGGTAGYTYQWSNGLTTEDISGLAAGTYTVTVTDANGCTVSSSITLTAPSPVTAATSSATYVGGWNISCNGMSDGSIDLTAGGGAPGYSYSWSSGQTTEDISGVAAGTYTVTVTDANGCTASSSITLTQPPVLSNGVTSATYVGGWNISCNGLSDGSIDQTVIGGTSTYTYQWSSSQTTEDISGVAAGTYTVTVTDANGCTASTSITLTEPTVLSNNVTAATYVGGWNISCNGMSNGSIDQSVTGGTSTYTYQWNSGQTSEDISGVAAGTYTVTVTDANGCTASTSITLTEPPTLSISTGTNDDGICKGEQSDVFASSNGGTGTIVFSWNQGLPDGTPHIVSPTVTTTYTATATDENGCTVSSSLTIEVYPNPVASFTSTEVCEGNATSFTSTSTIASGSIVDYQWDFSGSNASGATATYLFPSAGSHTVSLTVTSDHGCMDTVTQNIIVNANPDPGFTADNLSGCVPLCVTFSDLSTVQGSSINSWDWLVDGQNLNTAQPTYCFNQTGVYNVSLTVTSAEGCSSTLAINNMIQVNPNPVAAFTIQYESIVLSEASFTPMNQSSGETSWLWDFGNNNTSTDELPLIHYTDTGIYCITLTVMNQYGCTDQAENCVYIYPDFYIYIPNSFTPNGDKTNDVFMIEGFGIKEVDLEIFDRWGNVVFHSPHLYVGWDGTHQASNEEVMQGVYVYKAIVIDFNNQPHEFMGHINLIR